MDLVKKEIIKTLDEIKTSSNYEKGLKDLVNKTFKNAWNYKAYKLPKWYKNTEYRDMGFEEKFLFSKEIMMQSNMLKIINISLN